MRRASKAIWGVLSAASVLQFAAAFGGLIVGAVAAGLADIPTVYRVLLLASTAAFVFCVLLAMIRLLPESVRRKAAPVPPVAPAIFKTAAAQVQRDLRERKLEQRRAIRRIREELLDNKASVGTPRGIKTKAWQEHEEALLERDDPSLHGVVSDAYRKLATVEPGVPGTADSIARQAIATAVKQLNDADPTSG